MTSHTRINYPDKPNAQCDCDVGKDHWWDQVRYDEPDYIQQLETALDIAETKLARIELILNDPTIDREDIAHTIWGLFDD